MSEPLDLAAERAANEVAKAYERKRLVSDALFSDRLVAVDRLLAEVERLRAETVRINNRWKDQIRPLLLELYELKNGPLPPLNPSEAERLRERVRELEATEVTQPTAAS